MSDEQQVVSRIGHEELKMAVSRVAEVIRQTSFTCQEAADRLVPVASEAFRQFGWWWAPSLLRLADM